MGSGEAKTLDPKSKGDVDLILSMSMMPKLMHLDYAKDRATKLPCTLSAFDVAAMHYELRAADDKKGTARIATSDKKGSPLAELLPVTNIMDMLTAAKGGKAASVSNYMLVTLSDAGVEGWRLYTGVPPGTVLAHDMAAALGGELRPIFRNHPDGKSDLFVPG